ncbi:hypothetical protein M8037_02725, partial [Sinorhizobium meliloti]|uniref:hypothetical protein n=1 Tax=Rhizobium meliloti TaxID=382 RepID=UPI0020735F8C
VTPKGSGAGDPTVGAFGRAAARPKAYRILYNISYARCRQADEGHTSTATASRDASYRPYLNPTLA